ncbi:MAG: Transporter [Akkermansiaceae bacterium]|nr:Transporter [Akkermansiaceae bacterium]
MDSFKSVLAAVIPVYLLIIAGAALRKLKVLRLEQEEPIFRLVFSVLNPCLILDRILGASGVRSLSTVTWGIGIGFALTVVSYGLTWIAAGWIGLAQGQGRRTFTLSAGVQNFGYTAIPVVEQLWKSATPMLFVHNLGVELSIWSVGAMLMTGEKKIQWKRLINGPVISVVLGLVMVGTGLDRFLASDPASPNPFRTIMTQLGSGAFPIAILLTGAVMVDMIGKDRPSWKVTLSGCGMRLIVLPAFLLTAAKFLPIPLDLKQVLVVQAAMPAAMTPIMMARLYGGVPGIAVQIVLTTTALSLLSLPVVIVLGRSWLGL